MSKQSLLFSNQLCILNLKGTAYDQQMLLSSTSNGNVLPDHMNKGQFINHKTKLLMKKTTFLTLLVIMTFGFLLTGCQQDDISFSEKKEVTTNQDKLPYQKIIRIYDKTNLYWVDMKLSSDIETGIDEMLAMNYILSVGVDETQVSGNNSKLSDKELKEIKDQENLLKSLSPEELEKLKASSPTLSSEVINSNIPEEMSYTIGNNPNIEKLKNIQIKTSAHLKSSQSLLKASDYRNQSSQDTGYRSIITKMISNLYTVTVTYKNKGGALGSWTGCGQKLHNTNGYWYQFYAFAPAQPQQCPASNLLGVRVEAYTTNLAWASITKTYQMPL